VTNIEWSSADALPFALCVSATVDDGKGGKTPIVVSVALGNIIPADHGLSIVENIPQAVPAPEFYVRRTANAGATIALENQCLCVSGRSCGDIQSRALLHLANSRRRRR
jgi:hypothetical protein